MDSYPDKGTIFFGYVATFLSTFHVVVVVIGASSNQQRLFKFFFLLLSLFLVGFFLFCFVLR